MTAVVRQACLLISFVLIPSLGHAQAPSIAEVSQVIPFAVSGSVTSGAVQPQIKEKSIGGTSSPSGAATRLQTGLASVVTSGEKISTTDNAAVSLVLGDVGSARMGASSEMRLPAQGQQSHSLEMLKGRLFLNVSGDELKQRKAEFKLKTPAALLAVKGTKFFSDSKEGVDTIGVHEGSVTVTEPKSGKEVVVEAGYGVEVRAGSLGEPRKLLADEDQLNAQYQLANVSRLKLLPVVGLGGRWVNQVWLETFRMFKDGKQITVTSPGHEYQGDEAAIISEYQRGSSRQTPEGYFRSTWIPPEGTQHETIQRFAIEGAALMKIFTDNPNLKIIGILFRYRTVNVEYGEVFRVSQQEARHISVLDRKVFDRLEATQLEASMGGIWKTGIVTRGGPHPIGEQKLIHFQWRPRKHRDVAHPVPPPSTVDVTDFELLLTE